MTVPKFEIISAKPWHCGQIARLIRREDRDAMRACRRTRRKILHVDRGQHRAGVADGLPPDIEIHLAARPRSSVAAARKLHAALGKILAAADERSHESTAAAITDRLN